MPNPHTILQKVKWPQAQRRRGRFLKAVLFAAAEG
jgi:hypothetical protein